VPIEVSPQRAVTSDVELTIRAYAAMLGRMAYQRMPPKSWPLLLEEIRAFIDPLIEDTAGRLIEWDPPTQAWTRAGS
jgi:hypothetical protein